MEVEDRRHAQSDYVEVRLDEAPVSGAPSSGSRGEPASSSRDGPSARTGEEEGPGPDVTRPLTSNQSVQFWRWLLFDRFTFMSPARGERRIPVQSTVALITVIRYLMAELAQVMEVAVAVARTRNSTMNHSDLDGDGDGDQVDMMQRFTKGLGTQKGRTRLRYGGLRCFLCCSKSWPGSSNRLACGTLAAFAWGLVWWKQQAWKSGNNFRPFFSP